MSGPSEVKLTAASITSANAGLNEVTVRVGSPNYPVPQVDYKFIVDVQYCYTNTFTIATIPDIDYLINSGTNYYFY